jgi:hypothetical protein
VSVAASIDDLRMSLMGLRPVPDAYREKMLHTVPEAEVVKREGFLLDACRGRRVLEFGASGPMHDAIVKVAAATVGVDREDGPGVVGFDLDDVSQSTLPSMDAPDVIVCGEVLEHLSNPGWFLTRLRRQYPGVPVVITVPNAFAEAGRKSIVTGVECVNRDHVAYYSWKTLTVLVSRAGYTSTVFAWYKGQPRTAEGLILIVE